MSFKSQLLNTSSLNTDFNNNGEKYGLKAQTATTTRNLFENLKSDSIIKKGYDWKNIAHLNSSLVEVICKMYDAAEKVGHKSEDLEIFRIIMDNKGVRPLQIYMVAKVDKERKLVKIISFERDFNDDDENAVLENKIYETDGDLQEEEGYCSETATYKGESFYYEITQGAELLEQVE